MISVVIPTLNRPIEVQAAVRSALNQTYRDLEVIVVIDGPGQVATENALDAIAREDPRLRYIVNLPSSMGAAETRNAGARAARGEWVAYLDDDDTWFPEKLEKQIRVAETMEGNHIWVVAQYLEKTATMERIWPETLPTGTERFSEYLFCDRGQLLPTSFLVSKTLMMEVPFIKGMRHMEDTDWMMRAAADPRTRLGAVPEPLSVYNNVAVMGRDSRGVAWQIFYEWGFSHRYLFTPLAYSMYLTKGVVPRARDVHASWREMLHLLNTALLLGSFSPKTVFFFLASTIFTREAKRKVREFFSPVARRAREKARRIETISSAR